MFDQEWHVDCSHRGVGSVRTFDGVQEAWLRGSLRQNALGNRRKMGAVAYPTRAMVAS